MAFCIPCLKMIDLRTAYPKTWGAAAKKHVALPRHTTIDASSIEVTIVCRWYGWGFWPIALVAFTFFLPLLAFPAVGRPLERLEGMAFSAVSLLMTYTAAAILLNRTTVKASPREVQVTHSGLPWPGNKRFAREEIVQLYSYFRGTADGASTTLFGHHVVAILSDGQEAKVVSGLVHGSQARFIEQEIELFWGIQDKPVTGELHDGIYRLPFQVPSPGA